MKQQSGIPNASSTDPAAPLPPTVVAQPITIQPTAAVSQPIPPQAAPDVTLSCCSCLLFAISPTIPF
jgi:hypothetical protein